jgi:hypothetical protein
VAPSSEAPRPGAGDGPRRPAAPPRLILAGRVLLLAAAAVAAVGAVFLARRLDPDGGSAARYVCPMHAEVTAPVDGKCPICGMALQPARAPRRAGPEAVPGETADMRRSELEIVRGRVYTVQVRAPASHDGDGLVVALLYKDEVAALVRGERGRFAPAGAPDETFEARLGDEPPEGVDAATARVRFHLAGAESRPAPSSAGWLILAPRTRELLTVPDAAVLHGPEGPYVLVASPDGRAFTVRRIEVGRVFYGLAVVTAGLVTNERVAANRAFYIDAERRLRADADRSAGAGP